MGVRGPYAAKAIVQHSWDVNHLDIWLTFRFPMETTNDPLAEPVVHDVMPPLGLWLVEADGVPKAVSASAWQDAYTMLLTVPNVNALPAEVTVEYDGPDKDLRITWGKQWEPFGPILSTNIPFNWQDVIYIDVVNKRVGIGGAPIAQRFEILSDDGSDRISIHHDNSSSYVRWTDGYFVFQTDEGTDTDTFILIKGKGDGAADITLMDGGTNNSWFLRMSDKYAYLGATGDTIAKMALQVYADIPISMFEWATTGETQKLQIYGRRALDALRRLDIGISPDVNDTALFSNVSNYLFGGIIHGDEYRVAGTKVVGAQGNAVADATGAGDVVLRLNELLAEIRTHGLIAP